MRFFFGRAAQKCIASVEPETSTEERPKFGGYYSAVNCGTAGWVRSGVGGKLTRANQYDYDSHNAGYKNPDSDESQSASRQRWSR
jgi:hypothetical protein